MATLYSIPPDFPIMYAPEDSLDAALELWRERYPNIRVTGDPRVVTWESEVYNGGWLGITQSRGTCSHVNVAYKLGRTIFNSTLEFNRVISDTKYQQ